MSRRINQVSGIVLIIVNWQAMIFWTAAGVDHHGRWFAIYSVFCALVFATLATRSIWRDRGK